MLSNPEAVQASECVPTHAQLGTELSGKPISEGHNYLVHLHAAQIYISKFAAHYRYMEFVSVLKVNK